MAGRVCRKLLNFLFCCPKLFYRDVRGNSVHVFTICIVGNKHTEIYKAAFHAQHSLSCLFCVPGLSIGPRDIIPERQRNIEYSNNAIYHANCAANVSASRLSRKRPLNNNENSSANKTRNCVNAVYESYCCFFPSLFGWEK